MYVLMSTNSHHEDWIFPYLSPLIQPAHKVAVLPFSFREEWISDEDTWNACYNGPESKYYLENVGPFERYGINLSEQVTFLNYFKDTPEQMRQACENADILFFTGGLPDRAVERIEALGLTEVIAAHPGLKIGVSAGALMLLPNFYVSPDDDYPELLYFKGLSLIDSSDYIEVHYDPSNPDQQIALQDALANHCSRVHAIGDFGAIFVTDSDWQMVGDVTCF